MGEVRKEKQEMKDDKPFTKKPMMKVIAMFQA